MADLRSRKHLFFDLDDTLWDFEKNSSAVLADLFREFELANKLNTDFDNFYRSYKKINQELWREYHSKKIDKDFLRRNRFDRAFKNFGYHDHGESLSVNELYLARSPHGRVLKEGCIEVLEYLQNRYSLHIITNGFKEVQQIKIEGSGLGDFFSNIIISEEHSLTKPDEKIFRLAESLATAKPEECVMIGDNFECDILGALYAGWETVYVSEQVHNFDGFSVKKLPELKSLF